MRHLFIPFFGAVTIAIILHFTTASAYYPQSYCGYNRSHNFFYGKKSLYDRLLYTNRTVRGASPYNPVTRLDVQFPPKWQPPRGIIYYIEVLDNYRDGLGACATLSYGGIGRRNATVTLMSNPNHPIDSTINVYGK
uniref:Unkown protein n=1 Tax=Riptortus pedestris TaxID=329032 RepID=R4WR48_RIPPE|nr:unkown protein [Riptortus pedestris]